MKIRIKPERASKLAAGLIRLICRTLRWDAIHIERIRGNDRKPMIWTLWHNRIFVLPYFAEKHYRGKTGCVLTSASGDGDVLSLTVERFGLRAIRGSSSRRGAAALKEIVKAVTMADVAITPDGPRGPRYVLQPGVLAAARLSGAKIMPVHVKFTHAFRLKTWDGFRVPMPFSRVRITFDDPIDIPRHATEQELEELARHLENNLRNHTETASLEIQP